ncbi:MAG: hypothetical protein NWE91_02765 [Candidatus Bathyarchaeota archaeon]|nr:hypothetical protein [Candidatus Bathyarchaeota archaeon]
MEIEIKINQKQRLAYIPKSIYNILGSNVKVTPNRAAVLMFAADVSINDVLKSLDIIKADLLHGIELEQQKRRSKNNE